MGSAGITKSGEGLLTVKNIRAEALNVAAGKVIVEADGGAIGASKVNTLAIAAGATLDLCDNKLIVQTTPVGSWNGSAYTGLAGMIQSGRNGGSWDGSGIVTSQSDALAGNLTTIALSTAAQ